MPGIVIVTAYYPPQNSAGANRLKSFADYFAGSGYRCTVIAPPFGKACDDSAEPAAVRRVEIAAPPPGIGFLRRFIAQGRVALALLAEARRTPADIYLVTSPFLAALLAAPWLLPAKRLLFDVRDLTWEYRIDGGMGVRLAQGILRPFAAAALRRARLVSVSSPAEYGYLARVVVADRLVLVSSRVEADVIAALAAVPRSPHAVPVILYAGTLGQAQGIEVLADVAAALVP